MMLMITFENIIVEMSMQKHRRCKIRCCKDTWETRDRLTLILISILDRCSNPQDIDWNRYYRVREIIMPWKIHWGRKWDEFILYLW